MGKNSRPSFQKRAKEKARQERRKEKDIRRAETKERRAAAGPRTGGDPDIAGIVPGPQPLPPEFELAPPVTSHSASETGAKGSREGAHE